jgi:hypothetical protein
LLALTATTAVSARTVSPAKTGLGKPASLRDSYWRPARPHSAVRELLLQRLLPLARERIVPHAAQMQLQP